LFLFFLFWAAETAAEHPLIQVWAAENPLIQVWAVWAAEEFDKMRIYHY
jgi:hypothetical protein